MNYKLRIGLLLFCLCPVLLFGQTVLSALGDMHSVVKGETWESVAAIYGVSVAELQAANPDVSSKKKLKKRTLLIIPKRNEQVAKDKQEPSAINSQLVAQVPLIRTKFTDMKVGVLLSFSDQKMVEFYRGFLMAADSVRKSGVNLDIHAWDCGTTKLQIESLLPKLSEMDVIIGPSFANQVSAVAEVCRERGIRLILPFS